MIINAKIGSTFLGREDHGIMTFLLHLSWQGAGQGYGGYGCTNIKIGSLAKLLDVVGVESWEKLPEKYVRIEEAGTLKKLGHLIEDKWFNLETDLK